MKKQNTNDNIYYANGWYYSENPKPAKVKISREKKRVMLAIIIALLAVYALHIYEKMWVNDFCEAVYSNNNAKAEQLLKRAPFNVSVREGLVFPFNLLPEMMGNTPIAAACEAGNIEMVEALIDRGANLRQFGLWNFTLLYHTMDRYHDNDLEMMKLLIENGAPIEDDPDSREGPALLTLAHMNCGDYEYYEYEGGEFDDIKMAKSKYDKERAEKIVAMYQYLETKTEPSRVNGEDVLMAASVQQNLALIEYLLNNHKVDVNAQDRDDGKTCLFYVLYAESEDKTWKKDTIELLISKGADPNIKNNEGKTAYDYAVEEGDKYLAELLKSYM